MISRGNARARKTIPAEQETLGPDFGPEEQTARRRIEIAADPANPRARIARARVISVYDRLWEIGQLSDGEREAADRLAIAIEAVNAAGGSSSSLREAVRSGPGSGRVPAERVLWACRILREARSVITLDRQQHTKRWIWLMEVVALNRWPMPPAAAELAPKNCVKLKRYLNKLAWYWRLDA